MSRFAAAIKLAAEQQPMSTGGPIAGRVLGADGDSLAYFCAGSDECSAGQARINLFDKLRSARDAAGAESVRVLVTAHGSNKGHRFAVAKAQPYQGNRDGGRRPKNWLFLRELLDAGDVPEGMVVEQTSDREADDLFAYYAARDSNFVIFAQDKDMRMIPGWHLDWLNHSLHHVPEGTWEQVVAGKVYGRKWFWMQMLHGDSADYVPGLPWYTDGSILKSGPNKGEVKQIRCGEKSDAVVNQLAQVHSDMGATLLLRKLYETCYGERWLVEMLEQGVLLWMRRTDALFDLANPGGPFEHLTTHELWPAAVQEIDNRTKLNLETTEDDRGGEHPDGDAGDAEQPLCVVSAAVPAERGGTGSQPPDGGDPSSTAQIVQRPVGEDREQLPPLRREEPRRVSAWGCALLAKA